MVMKKIKEFFLSLFIALAVGMLAGLIARYSVFPLMALLHNRWINIISSETVKLVYFWAGQIVGSLVLIGYMYKELQDRDWSKVGSVIAIVLGVFLLLIIGLIVGVILGIVVSS